jgi:hypothetical protein
MITNQDIVVVLCSFFTVGFCSCLTYVALKSINLLKRKHKKELAEKQAEIDALYKELWAVTLLYHSAPVIVGKDQKLPLGKIQKANGTMREVTIGGKRYIGLESEIQAYSKGKTKVCRSYWEWSSRQNWKEVHTEYLMVDESDVAKSFVHADSTHCYKDSVVDVLELVKN